MSFEKKIMISVIVLTVVIFGVGFVFLNSSSTPQVLASQNAKAYTIEATSADWGNIPMSKGNVTKVFTIKNIGTDILKLYNIKTSCHCTKAYVNFGSEQSPDFGMNSYSSWVGEVAPGEEAKLFVVFDPAYHGPQGVGPITRFVSVETNDKTNTKLTFTVTGIVIK